MGSAEPDLAQVLHRRALEHPLEGLLQPADAQVRRTRDVRHRERLVRAGVDRLDGRADTDVPVLAPAHRSRLTVEAVQVEQGTDDVALRLVPGERLGTFVAQRPHRTTDAVRQRSTEAASGGVRRSNASVPSTRYRSDATSSTRSRSRCTSRWSRRGTPCRSAARSGRASGCPAACGPRCAPRRRSRTPSRSTARRPALDGDVPAQGAVHLGAPDAHPVVADRHVAVPVVVVDVRRVPGLAGVHAREVGDRRVGVRAGHRYQGPGSLVRRGGHLPSLPRVPGPRSVSRGSDSAVAFCGQGPLASDRWADGREARCQPHRASRPPTGRVADATRPLARPASRTRPVPLTRPASRCRSRSGTGRPRRARARRPR